MPATLLTHHVDDLLERHAEAHPQRVALVGNGTLKLVVRAEQVVQQTLLVRTLLAA